MKVLVAHNHYQQPGGEDQVFAAETKLLLSRGHQVLRYTAHNDRLVQLGRATAAASSLWNHTSFRDLRAVLRAEQPEVLHVHNTLPLLSPAVYYAAKAENVPVIQTLHNYRLLCPNGLLFRDGKPCEECIGRRVPSPGIRNACYRGSRAATATVAATVGLHGLVGTWTNAIDTYIALTDFARRKFVAGGIPEHQIAVKPNFVESDPGVGTHAGGFALFVGRLSPEKGVETLLDVWHQENELLPLKIVGSGPLQDHAGPTPNVHWEGAHPHQRVLKIMQDAAFLIFPSLWYETFGLTLIEAFATGLPVIASRVGAMDEIVREGHTGLKFVPGDSSDLAQKVRWAMEHPAEMQEMGDNARQEFLSKYTADKNYEILMEIYRTATRGKQAMPH